MSIPVRSYKATCHSKVCVNGQCQESSECNAKVKLTNQKTGQPGAPGKTGNGGYSETPKPATTTTPPATDLPALEGSPETGTDTNDPIADFIRWLEELFARLFGSA